MTTVWIDLETYNTRDIKTAGTYEYARTCEILLTPYAIDDGPVVVWDNTAIDETPDDLDEAFKNSETMFVAHNAMFDRNVLKNSWLAPASATRPDRWRCTMVKGLLHGFTGSLDAIGKSLGLTEDKAKISDGRKLINRFCKPAPSNHKADRYTRETHPEEWSRFIEYAKRDVEAMREIDRLLPEWNVDPAEYHCDQRINDFGFCVDRELLEAGIKTAVYEKQELADRFVELTKGEVARPSLRDQFLAYLNKTTNLGLENTQAATLRGVLSERVVDAETRELIEIAIESNKTSNSKYAALGNAVSKDGRFRGGLQFSGAARTRRWCLTGDHEVLTEQGWVRLDEWGGGVIAQWGNGDIYFEHADRVRFEYEGEMIHAYRPNRIDAFMTPDHVLCASGLTGRKTAGTAYGGHVTGVEKHGVLRRKPVSTIRTRVLVMLQHDGYRAGSTVEWCFSKKRKSTRCQKLLSSAGIAYTVSQKANGVYRIRVPVASKPDWLVKKDFGSWLLTEKHCPRTFIDEIQFWDGGGRRDKQVEVCSKEKINAEWTATMAHLAGFSANLARRSNGYWFVNVSKSGNRVSIKPDDWSKSAYKGSVFCAVTRTGFFLTRRNGIVHVTGNSGRNFQPQNLPSRGIPKAGETLVYINALKQDVHKELYAGELMRFGSAAVRGLLIAPKNKKIVATDLSNIEGRANAWLAGEKWKLDAFVDYDTLKIDDEGNPIPDGKGDFEREGPDLYNVTAGGIIGKDPYVINKDQRQLFGKIPDLAFGYQGGVGACQNFANAFNIRLADYWESISGSVEGWCIDKAESNYNEWGKERAGDLPSDEWIASETIKLSWRDRHPAIRQLWYDSENAAKNAIEHPGKVFRAGKHITFQYVRYHGNTYLRAKLPSGKYLCYYRPKLTKDGIQYWGAHPLTKQWSRLNIYGGKFVENFCQSLSRDILCENLLRAEAAGYTPILTVHDEVVCEVPDSDEFNEKHLSEIIATRPQWAKGFPLAAAGFEDYRYRKD